MKIELVSVFVQNPIAAHTFYTEVLGFQSKIYMPEASLAIVVSPEDPGGTALLLEPNENPVASTYQQAIYKMGLPVIIFSVRDVHAEYERLKSKGVVFRNEPTTTDVGTEVILDDTCGNLVQIYQLN